LKKIPGLNAKKVIDNIHHNCYDSTFVYPLVVADGHDCVVVDIDGNEFLDFTSNIGSSPLGYGHPDIMKVRAKYAKIGNYKIAGQDFYCEEHAEISKKLLSIISGNYKIFFCNSGTEAVENSIKLAYKKMGPLPAISCMNAFHGRTLGALSFTSSKPEQKQNFPQFPTFRIKFCTGKDTQDVETTEALLKENKIAFIITETIQGEGGYNIASKEFIKNLRRLATKYSVPLILDEVQSGLGRTGKWWAFEHYDVKPDIMSMSKSLQVGAAVYEKRYEPKQRGVLSSTWGGGDRIAMATGAKIIEVIRRDKLLDNVSKRGKELKKGLDEMTGKHGIIDVRGLGLMIGIEFENKTLRDKLVQEMFKKHLLILGAGKKSIRLIPSLIITKEQVQQGLEIMYDVFSKIQSGNSSIDK